MKTVLSITASTQTKIQEEPSPAQRLNGLNLARGLGWAILVVLLLPRLAAFLGHSWDVLSWPYQVDYDEGLNLSAAWNLAQGHNIYANSQPDHFIAAPYPPLYFILNAIGIKLFGVQFAFGRTLSVLATLAIGGLIGWAVWLVSRRNGSRALDAGGAALVAGLFWFGLPPVYIWGSFYKQDMVAIAVALTALVLVYRWQDSRWLWLTAPLMAVAFFAKQNELMASAIGCGYILVRDWRRGWKLSLLTALCLLVPFGLLDLLTKNGYYNHIIGYQLVPWDFSDMARRLGQVFADHPVLIGLAAAYLLGCLIALGLSLGQGGKLAERWRKVYGLLRGWLFPLYLVVAGLSLFTVGAYQGNYNLVLDLFPPLLIVVGSALAWLSTQSEKLARPNYRRLATVAALVAGVALAWQSLNLAAPGTYYHLGTMPGPDQQRLMDQLQREIAATPGPLVTEDVYLALSAGRAVPYDNLYHMRLESEHGKWDDRQFLQDLRDRRFAVVLLEHGSKRWTDAAWQVLNDNYELTFPSGIDLWRPRPRPLTPEYALAQCQLAANGESGRLNLLGWSQGATSRPLQAGQSATLTTYWQLAAPFASNYVFYVHLVDSHGQVVAQRDAGPVSPQGQALPLPGWQAGPTVLLDQTLPLPATLKPGDYRLTLGAYRPQNGQLQHLSPQCGAANSDEINLGTLKING